MAAQPVGFEVRRHQVIGDRPGNDLRDNRPPGQIRPHSLRTIKYRRLRSRAHQNGRQYPEVRNHGPGQADREKGLLGGWSPGDHKVRGVVLPAAAQPSLHDWVWQPEQRAVRPVLNAPHRVGKPDSEQKLDKLRTLLPSPQPTQYTPGEL